MTDIEFKEYYNSFSKEINSLKDKICTLRYELNEKTKERAESIAQEYGIKTGDKIEVVYNDLHSWGDKTFTKIGFFDSFEMNVFGDFTIRIMKIKKDGTPSQVYYPLWDTPRIKNIISIKILNND